MSSLVTARNLLNFGITGVSLGGVYALSSVGLVVVYRATGVINFAHGAIGAVSALLLANELDAAGWPFALRLAVAVLVGVALAVGYGRGLAARLSHRDPTVRAVGTLGFALMLLGFCGWRWTARIQRLELPTDRVRFDLGDVKVTLSRVLVVALAVVLTIVLSLLLRRTRVGLDMRALADDRAHAALVGVPVARTETVAWAIGGAAAGLSGVLFGAVKHLDASSLTFLVVPAIAAALVGQLRSLWWALGGAFAIGLIEAELSVLPAVAPVKDVTQFVVATLALLAGHRVIAASAARSAA